MNTIRLDVRTILVIRQPGSPRVLLLRRNLSKGLFPGLITGVGGKVELALGEAEDITAAALRELEEETPLFHHDVHPPQPKLVTIRREGEHTIVLLVWLLSTLCKEACLELTSVEGDLEWYDENALPLSQMVPTAKDPIPFILGLPDDDHSLYFGYYLGESSQLVLIPV